MSDGGIEGWAWGSGSPPAVKPAAGAAADEALAWLHRRQNITDGSYNNDLGDSVEMLLAVTANQINPADWVWYTSPSLLNYVLKSDTAGFVNNDPAGFGKLAVALSAANACWPAGTEKTPDTTGTPGEYSLLSGPQAWAMLGMAALDQTVPADAVQVLKNQIKTDGGWSWLGGATGETDGTSLAIQALLVAGEPVTSTEVVSGLAFLKSMQMSDGGFATSDPVSEGEGNSNSTAYTIHALAAVGEDATSASWTVSGNNPVSFLTGLQQADGQIPWRAGNSGDIERATRQAVPALLNTAFPINVADLQTCSAAISVEKLASPGFAAAGQTVTYTYHITNTGNVEVDLIAVDDKLGDVFVANDTLAAGRSTHGTLVYAVTATDTASTMLANTVEVTGTPPTGAAVTGSDTATVAMVISAQIQHLAPFAADEAATADVSAQSSEALILIKNGFQSLPFSDLKFGQTSNLFDLAQVNGTVVVTPAIIPGLQTTIPIAPDTGGSALTIVLIGDNINDDAPLEALLLTGTTTAPAAGNGWLRITHLASFGDDRDDTAADVDVQDSGGSLATFPKNGVKYKDSIGYIQVPAGVYSMTVSYVSGGDPLSLVFETEADEVGDIFIAGNNTNQALGVQSTGVKDLSDSGKIYLPIVVKDD